MLSSPECSKSNKHPYAIHTQLLKPEASTHAIEKIFLVKRKANGACLSFVDFLTKQPTTSSSMCEISALTWQPVYNY